jgi:membrane protease subunit (stomatin/prohibitin family)
MGLMDLIRSELIEIIEWNDPSRDIMMWRFQDQDHQIKMGAQLIVRESQEAIFIKEGKFADLFSPGRYELTTRNLPILSTINGWKYGFESPFKCEVYFCNTRLFTDLKWGTSQPLTVRDPEFGPLRIRGFGIFAVKIIDPKDFFTEVTGTNSVFSIEEISGQLKRTIISGFSDLLAESKIPFLDLAANLDELSKMLKEKLNGEFGSMGLELSKFFVENLSLPENVQAYLDKRSQISLVGDLNKFTQFQTAEAIGDAAKNPGGMAGLGAGMGAGFAVAQQMAGAMGQQQVQQQAPQQAPNQAAAAAPAAASTVACHACGKPRPTASKFCPDCGAPAVAKCPKCGIESKGGTKFCPECGTKL